MGWKSECEKAGYNGAVYGYSPFDMDDRECYNWGDEEPEYKDEEEEEIDDEETGDCDDEEFPDCR